jgi:hypothetical protein
LSEYFKKRFFVGKDSLTGLTALVTGGALRLGRATALALAGEGVDVIIHYRASAKEAAVLCDELRALGVKAWSIEADFSRQGEAEALIGRAVKEAGRVDILINNAAVFPEGTLSEMTLDDLNHNIMVNAWAPFALSRSFAKVSPVGKIINMLDTRLKGPDAPRAAYHISKHLFALLTRLTAVEFAPGVSVNAVAPGLVLAPAGSEEGYLEGLCKKLPLKRIGDVSDVTAAILYLLKSSFVTGQVLYVDGGRHLRGG